MFRRALPLLALPLLTALSLGQALAATTQHTVPVDHTSTASWESMVLAEVLLPTQTTQVTSLTGSARLKDHGSGPQSDANGLHFALLIDGLVQAWSDPFAGATHTWTEVSYDLALRPQWVRDDLQLALADIDWSSSPTVALQLRTNPVGFDGWALYVQQARFSVGSTTPFSDGMAQPVPEPATLALGVAALAVLAGRRTLRRAA